MPIDKPLTMLYLSISKSPLKPKENMSKYIIAWICYNNSTWGSFKCNNLKEAKKDGREVARGNTLKANTYTFSIKRKV